MAGESMPMAGESMPMAGESMPMAGESMPMQAPMEKGHEHHGFMDKLKHMVGKKH